MRRREVETARTNDAWLFPCTSPSPLINTSRHSQSVFLHRLMHETSLLTLSHHPYIILVFSASRPAFSLPAL
ncbi:Uncharacterized protein HZ326_16989 [Fusarium oxysporum f. sp. albedinis]|nr:Uncharacterized protein HZ326_16989 [Fusarium oxysporum f. sp. albedinis]